MIFVFGLKKGINNKKKFQNLTLRTSKKRRQYCYCKIKYVKISTRKTVTAKDKQKINIATFK